MILRSWRVSRSLREEVLIKFAKRTARRASLVVPSTIGVFFGSRQSSSVVGSLLLVVSICFSIVDVQRTSNTIEWRVGTRSDEFYSSETIVILSTPS